MDGMGYSKLASFLKLAIRQKVVRTRLVCRSVTPENCRRCKACIKNSSFCERTDTGPRRKEPKNLDKNRCDADILFSSFCGGCSVNTCSAAEGRSGTLRLLAPPPLSNVNPSRCRCKQKHYEAWSHEARPIFGKNPSGRNIQEKMSKRRGRIRKKHESSTWKALISNIVLRGRQLQEVASSTIPPRWSKTFCNPQDFRHTTVQRRITVQTSPRCAKQPSKNNVNSSSNPNITSSLNSHSQQRSNFKRW